jgi:hypothetical protein
MNDRLRVPVMAAGAAAARDPAYHELVAMAQRGRHQAPVGWRQAADERLGESAIVPVARGTGPPEAARSIAVDALTFAPLSRPPPGGANLSVQLRPWSCAAAEALRMRISPLSINGTPTTPAKGPNMAADPPPQRPPRAEPRVSVTRLRPTAAVAQERESTMDDVYYNVDEVARRLGVSSRVAGRRVPGRTHRAHPSSSTASLYGGVGRCLVAMYTVEPRDPISEEASGSNGPAIASPVAWSADLVDTPPNTPREWGTIGCRRCGDGGPGVVGTHGREPRRRQPGSLT